VEQCPIPEESFCSTGAKSKGFGKKKINKDIFQLFTPTKATEITVTF
jgi:hypothetical protein